MYSLVRRAHLKEALQMWLDHAQRTHILLHLNHLNKLTEDLEQRIVQAGDWLFLSEGQSPDEVTSCLKRATDCAVVARQTLEALEEQIRKSGVIAQHLRLPD